MDITKLDLNWGGAGFPSYDGRMEDDGPMDSDARAEAAMAAFNGDPDPNAADPNAADPNAADPNAVDPNAADPNAADPNAVDPNAPKLTDEQLQADPRFKEVSEFHEAYQPVLDKYGIPDAKEADLQLADAQVLYQIATGKAEAAQLMDTFLQVWPKEAVDKTAQSLIGWLTKQGYLKDGQVAAGAKPAAKPGDAGFKDPVAERLDKLENDRRTEGQRAEAQRVQAHQESVFKDKFLPAVNKFCEQKGIPKEDYADYQAKIAQLINGNKGILGRIEKGNFVDVQKLFTQIYNAEVQKLQRWTKAQTAANKGKQNQPRIPAGGGPPAPAGQAKPVAKTRDERIATATEML